jgi:hypothetical protein
LECITRTFAARSSSARCSLEIVVVAAFFDFLIAQINSRVFAALGATSELENTRVIDVLSIGGVSWNNSRLLKD